MRASLTTEWLQHSRLYVSLDNSKCAIIIHLFFGIIFFTPRSFYRPTSLILTSLLFFFFWSGSLFQSDISFMIYFPPQFRQIPPPSTLSPQHRGKARTHPDWLKSLFSSASPPEATSAVRLLWGGESLSVSRLAPGSCYLNVPASFDFISSEQTRDTPRNPGHQHGCFYGLWVRDTWHD